MFRVLEPTSCAISSTNSDFDPGCSFPEIRAMQTAQETTPFRSPSRSGARAFPSPVVDSSARDLASSFSGESTSSCRVSSADQTAPRYDHRVARPESFIAKSPSHNDRARGKTADSSRQDQSYLNSVALSRLRASARLPSSHSSDGIPLQDIEAGSSTPSLGVRDSPHTNSPATFQRVTSASPRLQRPSASVARGYDDASLKGTTPGDSPNRVRRRAEPRGQAPGDVDKANEDASRHKAAEGWLSSAESSGEDARRHRKRQNSDERVEQQEGEVVDPVASGAPGGGRGGDFVSSGGVDPRVDQGQDAVGFSILPDRPSFSGDARRGPVGAPGMSPAPAAPVAAGGGGEEPFTAERTEEQAFVVMPGRPFWDVRSAYALGRELGRGNWGVTRECWHRRTGKVLAIKSISKTKLQEKPKLYGDAVKTEVAALSVVSGHPGIVRLEEVAEDEKDVHLVMELCEGGDLLDLLSRRTRLSEQQAAQVIHQLGKALHACHAKGIAHRDVKLENILLDGKPASSKGKLSEEEEGQQQLRVKLADFGVASFLIPGDRLTNFAGSPYYVAPEVVLRNYDLRADIWSLGVILYILICGRLPFWHETRAGIFERISAGKVNTKWGVWKTVSPDAVQLVHRMLALDPDHRISLEELAGHPWVVAHTAPLAPVVTRAVPTVQQTSSHSIHSHHHRHQQQPFLSNSNPPAGFHHALLSPFVSSSSPDPSNEPILAAPIVPVRPLSSSYSSRSSASYGFPVGSQGNEPVLAVPASPARAARSAARAAVAASRAAHSSSSIPLSPSDCASYDQVAFPREQATRANSSSSSSSSSRCIPLSPFADGAWAPGTPPGSRSPGPSDRKCAFPRSASSSHKSISMGHRQQEEEEEDVSSRYTAPAHSSRASSRDAWGAHSDGVDSQLRGDMDRGRAPHSHYDTASYQQQHSSQQQQHSSYQQQHLAVQSPSESGGLRSRGTLERSVSAAAPLRNADSGVAPAVPADYADEFLRVRQTGSIAAIAAAAAAAVAASSRGYSSSSHSPRSSSSWRSGPQQQPPSSPFFPRSSSTTAAPPSRYGTPPQQSRQQHKLQRSISVSAETYYGSNGGISTPPRPPAAAAQFTPRTAVLSAAHAGAAAVSSSRRAAEHAGGSRYEGRAGSWEEEPERKSGGGSSGGGSNVRHQWRSVSMKAAPPSVVLPPLSSDDGSRDSASSRRPSSCTMKLARHHSINVGAIVRKGMSASREREAIPINPALGSSGGSYKWLPLPVPPMADSSECLSSSSATGAAFLASAADGGDSLWEEDGQQQEESEDLYPLEGK